MTRRKCVYLPYHSQSIQICAVSTINKNNNDNNNILTDFAGGVYTHRTHLDAIHNTVVGDDSHFL